MTSFRESLTPSLSRATSKSLPKKLGLTKGGSKGLFDRRVTEPPTKPEQLGWKSSKEIVRYALAVGCRRATPMLMK